MSKRIIVCASLFCSIFLTIKIYAETSQLGYKEGELLVRFAPKQNGEQKTLSERTEFLSNIDCGTIQYSYKLVPGLTLVKLPKGKTVKDSIETINKEKNILYAVPNHKLQWTSTFPNDPNFSFQWGLHNTGQSHPIAGGGYSSGTSDSDIDANDAWDIATDSNIIVAVIDTGVDYDHPDLAANMWINQGEISGDEEDNDENGYMVI